MSKELITFEEFLEIEKKLEITYGNIVAAERIPKSTKLLALTIIFGADEADERTVVTNLGSKFHPDEFLGLTLPFITNLTPSVMMGVESQAMIMVGEINGAVELNNFSLGSKLL
jgi:methionyl-tRNA synthetase